jgi:cysteine synthase B
MNTIMLDQITIAPTTSLGLEAAVGNTPMLPLERLGAHLLPKIKIFAKAEWFNPSGSVKDRPALNILRSAITEGKLRKGKRLLDSTSGNMGIAYATFAAAYGIPVTLTLPANASRERMAILRALGAELILTDPLEGSDGAMLAARQLAQDDPGRYYYANQYDNPANWQAHFLTTGPEIVQQTQGKITHFVSGLGTSGTLTGVSRYLLQYNPDIQIYAVQPASPLHGLEGLKHLPSSHLPGIFDPCLADQIIEITTEESYQMVRRLGYEQGLFVGISSGAVAAAALKIANELTEGIVVTIFPDAGFKYLSDERLWVDVSQSTTNATGKAQ